MRLRCLAGAYAGQIQDYGSVAGLSALRAGTAERLIDEAPAPPVVLDPTPAVAVTTQAPVGATKGHKKHTK